MNLTFVICSNGFGHLNRVISVLSLIVSHNNLNINVICNLRNKKILQRNILFTSINYCTSLMKYEIDWLNENDISFEKYLLWLNDFMNSEIICKSDLIVSDNLVIPLFSKKKNILMGSFLWHDIINDSNEFAKKISILEKEILSKTRPKIICLELMHMSSITDYTKILKVPWFTERINIKNKANCKEILITGGGTKQFDSVLIKLAHEIAKKCINHKIYLGDNLFKTYKQNKMKGKPSLFHFDFKEKSFLRISTIICRPGIGILTDSVKYSIPVVALSDNRNIEISHNASKVKFLKMGISIEFTKENLTDLSVKKIIKFVNDNDKLKEYSNRLSNHKVNGNLIAAEIILKELYS